MIINVVVGLNKTEDSHVGLQNRLHKKDILANLNKCYTEKLQIISNLLFIAFLNFNLLQQASFKSSSKIKSYIIKVIVCGRE